MIALLKEHQDDRGITHWQRMSAEKRSGMKSYGVGLTILRKLAKQIGRNSKLAATLWKSDVYEARVIALLIDDPKSMTPEQAEAQVDELGAGMLAHVFASCDATLAKTPFAFDLVLRWQQHDDPMRRRCAYGLIYELSKKKSTGRLAGMDDAWCLACIAKIQKDIHGEDMWVRESMLTALMGLGKRNPILNDAGIAGAKEIGPVDIDYGPDNACEPLDVLKHLTSDYLQKKMDSMRG